MDTSKVKYLRAENVKKKIHSSRKSKLFMILNPSLKMTNYDLAKQNGKKQMNNILSVQHKTNLMPT